MSTHLGRPLRTTLFLSDGPFTSVDWWWRNSPNGTHDRFRVPLGMVLVITDVDWNYTSSEPGTTQTFRLFIAREGHHAGVLDSLLDLLGSPTGVNVFDSLVVSGPLGSGERASR